MSRSILGIIGSIINWTPTKNLILIRLLRAFQFLFFILVAAAILLLLGFCWVIFDPTSGVALTITKETNQYGSQTPDLT